MRLLPPRGAEYPDENPEPVVVALWSGAQEDTPLSFTSNQHSVIEN